MFRKLVSNLSFSPALIHEVGFYAYRLRKEGATRQLTVVFMIMALIVQSLAVFSPPESANASSKQDLLLGGVTSKEDLITRYNANESNIKDIFTTAGITSENIEQMKSGTISSKDNNLVMGRLSHFTGNDSEATFTYTKSDSGAMASTYMSPLKLWDTGEVSKELGTQYEGWVGQSAELGWFAILKQSANLVTKTLPKAAFSATSPLKQEVSTINLSRGGVAANTVLAKPGDRISYTIAATNSGSTSHLAPLAITLDDVLEYATIIDNGAGTFDEKAHVLSWPPVTIDASGTERRTFVIQLLDPLPATAHGSSNSMSYDCVLSSSYGSSSEIRVDCPSEKDLEATVGLMPTINMTGNAIFALVITSIVLFFYFRTKQLKEEIRLIRHNLNEGAL
jgi:uncharacterized repeat protein (TIGR01451 family)